MGLLLLIIVFPLLFVLNASYSDPNAVYQGKVLLLPKDITFEGYRRILKAESLWRGYRNTILYTVLRNYDQRCFDCSCRVRPLP